MANELLPGRLFDPRPTKSEDHEDRVGDSFIGLIDLSKAPKLNDRRKKLGNLQGTLGVAIHTVLPGYRRIIKDGYNSNENTDQPFEFDNWDFSIHEPDELDRVWAIRAIVDQQSPHRLRPNRSTKLIDQSLVQNQGAAHDFLWIKKLRRVKRSRVLRYTPAGIPNELDDSPDPEAGKGKAGVAPQIPTGAKRDESHVMLNFSAEAGWATDGKAMGQFAQLLTFPNPKRRFFERNEDREPYTQLTLRSDAWFHFGDQHTGPLGLIPDDFDRFDCDELERLPDGELDRTRDCRPLTGFLYYSKRLRFLRPVGPGTHEFAENPLEDNPPKDLLRVERVIRPVVFFALRRVPIELPTGKPARPPPGRPEPPPPRPPEPPTIPTGDRVRIEPRRREPPPTPIPPPDVPTIPTFDPRFPRVGDTTIREKSADAVSEVPAIGCPIQPVPTGGQNAEDTLTAVTSTVNKLVAQLNALCGKRAESLEELCCESPTPETSVAADKRPSRSELARIFRGTVVEDIDRGLVAAVVGWENDRPKIGKANASTLATSIVLGIVRVDAKRGDDQIDVDAIPGQLVCVKMKPGETPKAGKPVYITTDGSGEVSTVPPVTNTVTLFLSFASPETSFFMNTPTGKRGLSLGSIVEFSDYATTGKVCILYAPCCERIDETVIEVETGGGDIGDVIS